MIRPPFFGRTILSALLQLKRLQKIGCELGAIVKMPAEYCLCPSNFWWLHVMPMRRYPRQRVLVVACDDYAYLVPFVEEDDYFFLKTVIPSRKATRDYLNQGETDAEN